MTSHIRDKSKDQVKGSAEILSLLETYFPDISEAAVESRRAAYRAAEKAEEQRLAIIAQKGLQRRNMLKKLEMRA